MAMDRVQYQTLLNTIMNFGLNLEVGRGVILLTLKKAILGIGGFLCTQ
jgi:hypothetical protein